MPFGSVVRIKTAWFCNEVICVMHIHFSLSSRAKGRIMGERTSGDVWLRLGIPDVHVADVDWPSVWLSLKS